MLLPCGLIMLHLGYVWGQDLSRLVSWPMVRRSIKKWRIPYSNWGMASLYLLYSYLVSGESSRDHSRNSIPFVITHVVKCVEGLAVNTAIVQSTRAPRIFGSWSSLSNWTILREGLFPPAHRTDIGICHPSQGVHPLNQSSAAFHLQPLEFILFHPVILELSLANYIWNIKPLPPYYGFLNDIDLFLSLLGVGADYCSASHFSVIILTGNWLSPHWKKRQLEVLTH